MAVTIRLQRQGTRNRPFYHIVAVDSRKKRDGACIEKLGFYDPTKEPSVMELKSDRIQHWFGVGAKTSIAVNSILKAKSVKVERTKTAVKTKSKGS